MPQSTYRLTVPQSLYDRVCDVCGQPFADSYLFGATLVGNTLTPRTQIGFYRMGDRTDFVAFLKGLGVTLSMPTPWPGKPDEKRLSHEDVW